MGQQQLILLVLATVIVGVAIVVGIRAFTENASKANADAMMQDAVRMANDAQAAVRRPDPFGGVDALTDITHPGIIGYSVTGTTYNNLNGAFNITADAPGIIITAEDDTLNANTQQRVTVAVCGLEDDDIFGAITLVNGSPTSQAPAQCP